MTGIACRNGERDIAAAVGVGVLNSRADQPAPSSAVVVTTSGFEAVTVTEPLPLVF